MALSGQRPCGFGRKAQAGLSLRLRTNVQTLRGLAQPAAVSCVDEPDAGDERRRSGKGRPGLHHRTSSLSGKTRQGGYGAIFGHPLKKLGWRGVRESSRYEGGINWLLTEMFWDVKVRHPELFLSGSGRTDQAHPEAGPVAGGWTSYGLVLPA